MSKKKDEGFNAPFGALKGLKKQLEDEEKKREAERAAAKGKPYAPKPAAKPAAKAGANAGAKKGEAAASSPDDELTFHRLMSGVTPLDHKTTRIPKSQQSVERSPGAELAARRANAKTAQEQEAAEVHEHLRSLVEGRARFEIADDGRRVEGRRVDLPPAVLRKLRHGTLPIDARIDLHGMHAGEARVALEAFLGDKRERGEKCVLVVHGKGEHSPKGMGVLRGEIAAWLSQSAASEHVAAFATATDDDGGEGAVYVLLRK